MRTSLFLNGLKFQEYEFVREHDFELLIVENSKTIFGNNTIYIDVKNKIEGKALGGAVPDGLLFDLKDKDNPDFYLIEVELAKHDFYRHIFPQITKFFAFFKNSASQNKLIEKIFQLVDTNDNLKEEFKKYLGRKEIYKSIKDAVENSQNILLVIDEYKDEIGEAQGIYADTWGKLVKVEVLKKYQTEEQHILTITPDFEEVEYVETKTSQDEDTVISEEYHLDGVGDNVKSVYNVIKNQMKLFDANLIFNPQKYYISIKKKKNFAYIQLKKKKMKIVVMLPISIGNDMISNHSITELSQSVQKFYNGPCFKVNVENEHNFEEIIELLKRAYTESG